MSYSSKTMEPCHPQQAIRAKCFHPSGAFIEFTKEEIEQSIPSRFEKMVRNYPDSIAVQTKNRTLTYDQLNKAANGLARALLTQSGGEGERIAVLLEHDASLLTAILGILKIGGVLVPMDPFFPHERNSYILDDSQAAIIVTSKKHLSLANSLNRNQHRVLNIDEIDPGLSVDNLGLAVAPHAIAYILYTSGSTGEPKGVFQNHRNALHDIMQYTNALRIERGDRMNLFYSCSARSLRAIFGVLLNGASLFFFNVKEEGMTDLTGWLMRKEIALYHSVPSVFRQFAGGLTGKEEFPKLRLIRLGGERVLARDVELYKRHFSPECLLCIGMGATETGTVRQYFIDRKTEIRGDVVPSGYAVADKEAVILNDAGEGVGAGGVGEIAIKSRYVALGYWRKPELTRAVFLPDPTGGDEQLYLTGDLGRMLPDGCLVHLGRKDFQVKIRGYRIEPSEIELARLGHGMIKEAAVVAREDRPGDKRLVAYVVADHEPAPTVSELRRFLKDKLPDYMMPSSLVYLQALPLTPGGKVNRLALPAPDRSRPQLDTPFQKAQTPVERALAEIWTEVLGLEPIGALDNFFDLGGHSLLATQVMSRVRDSFQVELPLRALFETPTVADLAVAIVQTQADEETARLLRELDVISDQEAQRRLAQTMQGKES